MIYKPNPISEFLLQIYNKILEFASIILNISVKKPPNHSREVLLRFVKIC